MILRQYILINLTLIFMFFACSQASKLPDNEKESVQEAFSKIDLKLDRGDCESIIENIERKFFIGLSKSEKSLFKELLEKGISYEKENRFIKRRGGDYCNMVRQYIAAQSLSESYIGEGFELKINLLFNQMVKKEQDETMYGREVILLSYLFNQDSTATFYELYLKSSEEGKISLLNVVLSSKSKKKQLRFLNGIELKNESERISKVVNHWKNLYKTQ